MEPIDYDSVCKMAFKKVNALWLVAERTIGESFVTQCLVAGRLSSGFGFAWIEKPNDPTTKTMLRVDIEDIVLYKLGVTTLTKPSGDYSIDPSPYMASSHVYLDKAEGKAARLQIGRRVAEAIEKFGGCRLTIEGGIRPTAIEIMNVSSVEELAIMSDLNR